MHPLFQVGFYTSQQLVLEGVQRWFHRPCDLDDVQRQRRTSLKNIIILLLKTAATGVLATILDAAIEYRHRQLLGVPSPDPNEDITTTTTTTDIFPSSSDASLHQNGYLSRSAITAWKSRLLYCIDEIERKLDSNNKLDSNSNNRRYTSSSGLYCIQEEEEEEEEEEDDYYISSSTSSSSSSSSTSSTINKLRRVRAHTSLTHLPSLHTINTEEDDNDRGASLAATVAQLTGLVQRGAPQSVVESKIELLLDSIIPGTGTGTVEEAGMVLEEKDGEEEEVGMCQICMDSPLQLAASDCQHGLCISCARQLHSSSSSFEYDVPKCPFCRRAINSYHVFPFHQ